MLKMKGAPLTLNPLTHKPIALPQKPKPKPAAKVVVQEDRDEEERDDFEGFGSITAMAQNKEKLVAK